MKITKGQLKKIIREEVARVITEQDFEDIKVEGMREKRKWKRKKKKKTYEYVVMGGKVVGTWNKEHQVSMRFLPNEEGKKRGFKADPNTPSESVTVKEAPPHSI